MEKQNYVMETLPLIKFFEMYEYSRRKARHTSPKSGLPKKLDGNLII